MPLPASSAGVRLGDAFPRLGLARYLNCLISREFTHPVTSIFGDRPVFFPVPPTTATVHITTENCIGVLTQEQEP